jgi:hypothetical protein
VTTTVDPVETEHEIGGIPDRAAKWDELGQGSVVNTRSAWLQEDDWLLHDDGDTTRLLG